MKSKFLIYIKNYDDSLAKRQPWYTIRVLKENLEKQGYEVVIINSMKVRNQHQNYTLIKVFSFTDFFKLDKSDYTYLITFPFYSFNKITRMGLKIIVNNFKHIDKIIFASLIPNFFIKKVISRAINVISISDYSSNYLDSISVKNIKFYPFSFGNWGDFKKETKDLNSNQTTIAYFGPPYTTRCFEKIVDFFTFLDNQHNFNKKIITRIEKNSLIKKQNKYLKKIKGANINFISGFLDRDSLACELSEVDVFILPFEIVMSDLPIVVLESLELGAKLVTTHESGITELTKNSKNVLIIDDLSPQEYDRIIEFINLEVDNDFTKVKENILNNNYKALSYICPK